jgi:hypothetical protein
VRVGVRASVRLRAVHEVREPPRRSMHVWHGRRFARRCSSRMDRAAIFRLGQSGGPLLNIGAYVLGAGWCEIGYGQDAWAKLAADVTPQQLVVALRYLRSRRAGLEPTK